MSGFSVCLGGGYEVYGKVGCVRGVSEEGEGEGRECLVSLYLREM